MQITKQDQAGARIALAVIAVVLSLGLLLNRAPSVLAQDTCPDALPARLSVGTQGRVRSDGPNDMYDEPGLNASFIGDVQALGIFDILDGPVCADDAVWWKVNYFGLIGWTQEGRDGVYWLNPYTKTTPTPRPAEVTNTSSTSSQSSSSTTDALPFGNATLERLWMQTFDNSEDWAQLNSFDLVGEVKDGGYIVQAGAMSGAYFPSDFTVLEDILPVSSLEKFELSFDVQSQSPDLKSQCGMLIINTESVEELRVMFCHGVLAMMPIAFEYGGMPAGGAESSLKTMEISVDPLDGAIHRLTLTGDGQNLRLSVDGQDGLIYPYQYALKAFMLVHIDANLEGRSAESDALMRFDNVTLSRPQECQLIATMTLKDIVVESLDDTVSPDLFGVTFYYGVTADADGYVTRDEAAAQRLEKRAAVTYDAKLHIGDRVSGFPTITRPVSCTAELKEVFFTVFEKRATAPLGSYGEPLGSKTTPFYENSLDKFPIEVSGQMTSYEFSRVYHVTYTLDVKPSDGTLVDTPELDKSGIIVEPN